MPTASSISIDDSLWPLRVVRFVGVATPEQFDHFLEEAAEGRGPSASDATSD